MCLCVVLALSSGRQSVVSDVDYGLSPLCSFCLVFWLCAARLLPARRALLGPPSVMRGASLQLCLVILVLMAARGLRVLDALVLAVFEKTMFSLVLCEVLGARPWRQQKGLET